MKVASKRRGTGLVDAIVTLFLLGVAGAVFSAIFPTGLKASRQAQEYKVAASIAQRKMEQIRAMPYESLTSVNLRASGTVDPDDTESPYSFTEVDSVAGQLTVGTGSISIYQEDADTKRVRVTMNWEGPPGSADRSITLTTLCADKRPRRVN
ncbi:MAG: hypothetical protein A2Z18_11310 [Armatimonadetes bacterium RBG_16_58_9]|nr:MAG: hypothetical protein A2Z18_11310 [Armatimonadetes bacterium RBG_16_58_9]